MNIITCNFGQKNLELDKHHDRREIAAQAFNVDHSISAKLETQRIDINALPFPSLLKGDELQTVAGSPEIDNNPPL